MYVFRASRTAIRTLCRDFTGGVKDQVNNQSFERKARIVPRWANAALIDIALRMCSGRLRDLMFRWAIPRYGALTPALILSIM